MFALKIVNSFRCIGVNMKRYGSVIKVKKEKLDEYKELHANAWPDVLKKIAEVNITNYSIFYGGGYLFSYYEYTGSDYAGDMKKMADDPVTQEWWKLTDPCQEKVEFAGEKDWWTVMEEVFHTN